MTEIEIIKELFKAYANHNEIIVELDNHETAAGVVAFFDGDKVTIGNDELPVSIIKNVCLYSENEINDDRDTDSESGIDALLMKLVLVKLAGQTDSVIEGLLYAIDENQIVILTAAKKMIVEKKNIAELCEKNDDTFFDKKAKSELNELEYAVINSDKERALELVENSEIMLSLGYSLSEIASMKKKVRMPLPWNDDEKNRLYNQGRRIYEIEGNRGNIAYLLFVSFLQEEPRPFDLRAKAVGTILDILADKSASDLVLACDEYRELIVQRDSLCYKAAVLLVSKGKVTHAQKLACGDVSDDTVFKVNPFDSSVAQKEIINSLIVPNKFACNQLLSQYANQDRQNDFFAIVKLMLPDIREDLSNIENLRKQFKICGGEFLNEFFICFPLLWMDPDIASRYIELNVDRTDLTIDEKRLLEQCLHTVKYSKMNELEEALVCADYNSFEVLRSNNSILFSYGYDAEEIAQIRAVDIALLQKKTTIERLLLIEGNRHSVAESVAWKDFIRLPKVVCSELFPLLLSAGNGSLIYELFNYSDRINEQLKSLKPLYVRALALLDYKDEFWGQVKDEWLALVLDSDLLDYAIKIAEENGDQQQVATMRVYSQMNKLNEFEIALVNGNAAKLRTIVADVNNLSEMGYNSEEISLILESTHHRVDFKADDKVAIANRIFTFQKNKNNVAEFYYKMAMLDGDLMAAYGLFSVYENECRFNDLCDIYNSYLKKNEGMVTAQMRGSYLKALYETQQFNDFVEYYNAHKEDSIVNRIIVLEVLLATKPSDEDVSNFLANLHVVSREDISILKKCIRICLANQEGSEYIKYAITLFNISFEQLEENDILELIQEFDKVDKNIIPQPAGNVILSLITKNGSYLKEWCEYLRDNTQDEKNFINLLEKIDLLVMSSVSNGAEIIREEVLALYQSSIIIPESLKRYLIPEMNNDEEKCAWLDKCLESVSEIDELKFTTFCKFANELGDNSRLRKLIVELSSEKHVKVSNLKKVIIELINDAVEKTNVETTVVLLDAILNSAGSYQLHYKDILTLYRAYMLIGNKECAYIADCVLKGVTTLNDNEKEQIFELQNELFKTDNLSLFSVIDSELNKIHECQIISLLCMWKDLFRITEEDTTAAEELRDYYNTPEKWSNNAKDLLAKHLFCNYKSEIYWQLLKQYYSNAEDDMKLNIEYQYAKTKPELFSTVMMAAQKQKSYAQLVEIINYILAESNTYAFDKCFKHMLRTINKCPGIFTASEIALKYIDSLFENEDLYNNGNALRFVLEVSECAGVVSEFAKRYVNSTVLCDYLFAKKLLCKVMLDENVNIIVAGNVVDMLKHVPHEVACLQVLLDMWTTSDFGDEVSKAVLRIIEENEQETLDEQLLYRLYIKAVICDEQAVFISAIDRIKKYYPELSVYDDIKKYELTSKEIEDNRVYEIYADEFSQLTKILDPDRMLKTIINMLPGDIFLTKNSIAHDSVYEFGMAHLSAIEQDTLKNNYELYTSVCNAFNEDDEFLCVFMKACFLRRWKEVVFCKIPNQYINDILKSDHSIKKLLLKRHYEILKWVFLSLLEVETDDENIIERAYTVLSAASIVRFNKNTLRRLFKMDEHYRDIVKKIFSIRMESATLRKLGYVGESILEIDDNEKVAYLICTLPPSDLSAIFNNECCFETLMNLPIERAQHIAEIYVGLFSEGRDNVFSRVAASIQSNNTVFALSNNPYEEDDSIKLLRKKYQKQLENIESVGDSASKLMLKNFELTKAEYLFYAVMSDSMDDCKEINPNRMDYISVITMLFNKKDVNDVKDFVWKLSKDKLLPLYSYSLQLLEQYVAAYKITNLIEDEEWKKTLWQVQYRAMTGVYLSTEERKIRKEIQQSIDVDRSYWLGKFMPVNEEQVSVYLEKMNALHSFFFEFREYLTYNGESIDDIDLDEEKFAEDLKHIEGKYSSKNKHEEIVKKEQVEGLGESVSDYLDNDILATLLRGSDVEPISNTEHVPLTYDECIGVIKFYATVKRESKNRRDISSFKNTVRWALLKKMDEEGYARDKFIGVLNLIAKDDVISKSQWLAIVSYLVKYFETIENLSQMSRMLENDLNLLQVLACEDGQNLKLFRRGELKAWKNIEGILSEMCGVDYLRLGENEQMQLLSAYRSKLLSNCNEKDTSSFAQINNKILRLVNKQITGLKNTAELIITVLDENKKQEVSVVWEKNNDTGYLYAVISNGGGANCENVVLTSKINVSKTRSFEISRIYSGEKVPFRETFKKTDLIDGQLTWDLEVSYFDSNKGKQEIVMHHITACVSIGSDCLNLGNISTGNPAKGKNFVGRTRELALLRNRYADEEQLPSMLIRGLKRSGKSSVLIQLTEYLKNKNKFVVVFVDGQSVGDDIKNAFIDKVIDGIRISYRSVEEYKTVIGEELDEFKREWKQKTSQADWIGQLDLFYFELSQLLGKKILIVVDEMESIFYNHRFESIAQEEMLYAAIRALIQKADNYVSFIFCGSDTLLTSCLEQRSETQMFQTLQYLEVGHMNHGDIQEIFRRQSEKYEINFSSDAVEAIWEYTDGLVWYAKLLGYLVINNIFAKDLTIRKEVNRWDILYAVQMLINGEIGTDKYDLVDACLNTPRTAIIHAAAGIMPDNNKEVSTDEILSAVKMMKAEGYINPRNGEEIPELNEESVKFHLDFLEKMQFVEPNSTKTRYKFTSELYRLFFRTDKKLHLFEERGIQ